MQKALIVLVDDNRNALDLAEKELRKRYGEDYEVCCFCSSAEAMADLQQRQEAGAEVALFLASCWMTEKKGVDFLQDAHRLFPEAKRGLLVNPGDPTVVPTLLSATALNMIDAYTSKPWREGDENFHSFVTDFLSDWARMHRPHFELVRIVGERWDRRAHELRDLLSRNGIPYGFYEANSDHGQRLLEYGECLMGPLPALIFADGNVLLNPNNKEVAAALNVNTDFREDDLEAGRLVDVVIAGAGPAGLSAAVYAASEGLRTIALEPEALGGQAGMSSSIRNYLGFPTGISGAQLASRAYRQAWLFGANFIFAQRVKALEPGEKEHCVILADGGRIRTRTVILATGVSYRRLPIPRLDELIGRGVFYGAASSEAVALRGEHVFVIGGGNSAGQAAMHLARFAKQVTMVVRGPSLSETMSDYLIKDIEHTENINVLTETEVVDASGEHRLEELVLQECRTGRKERVKAGGLFVMIGAAPRTDWLPPEIRRDENGYIMTGRDLVVDGSLPPDWPLKRPPFMVETSVPRIFAVGDVRYRSVKRVASAVGEGSIAIQFVHQVLGEVE